MRADPIAPSASEHERHVLEAHFSHRSARALEPMSPGLRASPTTPALGSAARATRLSPGSLRLSGTPRAAGLSSAARTGTLPFSASRDAAARRRYPLSGVPMSPVMATSTPHTNWNGHARHESNQSPAPTHRTAPTALADLSDSDEGEHQEPVSPAGPYDVSVARAPAYRATPPGRSPHVSPRVGQCPALKDGDLDRLDRLQMGDRQSTIGAAATRFRPKTQANGVGYERSVSGGSGGVSEASTKVAGWDGGRRTPTQFVLPSGNNVGTAIPPQGLFCADVTGYTEALCSPHRSMFSKHQPLGSQTLYEVQEANREESLEEIKSHIDQLRGQVTNLTRDYLHLASTNEVETLKTELANVKARQAAPAPAQPAPQSVARPAAFTSNLSSHGAAQIASMPLSPSPPRETAAPLHDVVGAINARLDASQAQVTRLLEEQQQSPSQTRDQPGSGPAGMVPRQQAPVVGQTPATRGNTRLSSVLSSRAAPAETGRVDAPAAASINGLEVRVEQLEAYVREADVVAGIALLRREVQEIAQLLSEVHHQTTTCNQGITDVRTQLGVRLLSVPAGPQPTMPGSDMSTPPLGPPASSPSSRPASARHASSGSETERGPVSDPVQPAARKEQKSSSLQPVLTVPSSSSAHQNISFSSPLHSAGTRFRRSPHSAEQQTLPTLKAPALPPRASEAQAEHSADLTGEDMSGTMLSELELSKSIDDSRLEPARLSRYGQEHTVDHSHDPKKCILCTRERRAERKRKARAAQAEAEAHRQEEEARATEALLDEVDTLINEGGPEGCKNFISNLPKAKMNLLLAYHGRLVEEFFHQRNVYAGLADELKLLGPEEVRYGITVSHVTEAISALQEIAARIDVLNAILPAPQVAH